MGSKKVLRQALLAQRQELSIEQVQQISADLVAKIRHQPWFQYANTVFAYRSFRQEISLKSLYTEALHTHVWGFPRCVGLGMVWHQWTGQASEEFMKSPYGIEEPPAVWPRLHHADVILVPTVACDRQGYRLGYGGGYYDRMFADLPVATRTIGIVSEQFLMDELPIDEWDQRLDGICTEAGYFEVSQTESKLSNSTIWP